MKFIFVTFLYFFLTQLITAQENEKNNHFEFSATPQVGSIHFDTDMLHKAKIRFAYKVDAGLLFELTSKLQLEVGLSFQSSIITQRDYSPLFPLDQKDGMALFYLSYYEYKIDSKTIGIPISVKLALSKRPNHFNISISGQIKQVLYSKANYHLEESGLIDHILDPNDFGIKLNKTQFFTGVGLEYYFLLNQKHRFSIGPTFEYSLSDILKESYKDQKPDFIGGNPFFMGIRFAFNGKFKKE